MLSTKIITCLLGLVLLLPLSASFLMMLRYRPMSEPELHKSLDEALAPLRADIDSKVEPGFPGAMAASVQIQRQMTLPCVSYRLWSFTPRTWVGLAGFSCCIIIGCLWIYSSFFSSVAISGGYWRSGMDESPPIDSQRGQMMIDGTSKSEAGLGGTDTAR